MSMSCLDNLSSSQITNMDEWMDGSDATNDLLVLVFSTLKYTPRLSVLIH